MTNLVNAVAGDIQTTFLHAAFIALAAVSAVMVGYFLLVRTSNRIFSHRRR